MTEPWKLSLREAAAAIAAGSLTPVALLESTLARIEAVEPRVLAWARIRTEDAHREAARLDNNPTTCNAHLKIAIEYERLAEVKERKSGGDPKP